MIRKCCSLIDYYVPIFDRLGALACDLRKIWNPRGIIFPNRSYLKRKLVRRK